MHFMATRIIAARSLRCGAGRTGFVCPKCGGQAHCIVGSRKLFQCNGCRRQTSVTAGTLINSTKAPLTTWLCTMYLITQTKQGISSIELGRRLGTTQTTAWKIKAKLAEVMRLSNDDEPLDGCVEMDDAYLGGPRSGGKTGRGSPGKRPIVEAVQTIDGRKPARLKIRRVARFKRRPVKQCKRASHPTFPVGSGGGLMRSHERSI